MKPVTETKVYRAEVTNAEKRVVVKIIPPSGAGAFSRSFYAICDAERWLPRLSRAGLRTRDCVYFIEKQVPAFELPTIRPILIADRRTSQRHRLLELLADGKRKHVATSVNSYLGFENFLMNIILFTYLHTASGIVANLQRWA